MGLKLSLYIAYKAFGASVATTWESAIGQLTRETADKRLAHFAHDVVSAADIRISVVGQHNIPSGDAFVFMSNHQSHVDIPILYYSLPVLTLRMVAKTELFRIPIWGAALRAGGMIEVDRTNREQAIASLQRAGEAIADGVNIWIAPEGSRSRNGQLGRLKKGGFHLAKNANANIIPVALTGTGNVLPPGGLAMRKGVSVSVVIGTPIATANRSVNELMDEVEQFLRRELPGQAVQRDCQSRFF